jgi:hypothetical protein
MRQPSTDAQRTVQRVAREYREKGYKVSIQPDAADLPEFLRRVRPDIVAESDDDKVVVEVKTRAQLPKSEELPEIARLVEGHPGWRFELVLARTRLAGRMTLEDMPDTQELRRWLGDAERILESGASEGALLLGWAVAEACLRRAAWTSDIGLDPGTSKSLLTRVFTYGLLDRDDFDVLSEAADVRNATAHGFTLPKITPTLVRRFLRTIHRILPDQSPRS